MEDINEERCVYCDIEMTENSVIYVREQVKEKWGSYPSCTKCWFEQNPNRRPVRVTQ